VPVRETTAVLVRTDIRYLTKYIFPERTAPKGVKMGKQISRIRVFGIMLIVLGCLALVDQIFNIRVSRYIWPFFIIVPGILIFFSGSRAEYGPGEPFAMLGAMVTMVGLILLFQSITDLWASWAYAWALVAPTSVGLGQLFYGVQNNQDGMRNSGITLVNIGLIMFFVGIIFFELILNLSGYGRNPIAWAVIFIGAGVIVLIRGFLPQRRG
jgi:hypothetical protein